MSEIFVSNNNIELALVKLKRFYQKEIAKAVIRHSFHEPPGLRKRRKHQKALIRLKKLEARSVVRIDEARRRFSHDERAL
jgi:ribosomal protein S21